MILHITPLVLAFVLSERGVKIKLQMLLISKVTNYTENSTIALGHFMKGNSTPDDWTNDKQPFTSQKTLSFLPDRTEPQEKFSLLVTDSFFPLLSKGFSIGLSTINEKIWPNTPKCVNNIGYHFSLYPHTLILSKIWVILSFERSLVSMSLSFSIFFVVR